MTVCLSEPPLLDNPDGPAPLLLVCDHAGNAIPAHFGTLGLESRLLEHHFAWDIGARALALKLAELVDAPLICAPVSRLVIDPNRACDAPDLIPVTAEGQIVPGNRDLQPGERQARIAKYHAPYHMAIETALHNRPDIVVLIAVHSFTPTLGSVHRPWDVGILHGEYSGLAQRMIAVLRTDRGLSVGHNQPYAPSDGVYYTLARHAAGRETAMIEVRNDGLRTPEGQGRWANLLANAIRASLPGVAAPNVRYCQPAATIKERR
jgi:predicted N-formylglutamate amidohydrolase